MSGRKDTTRQNRQNIGIQREYMLLAWSALTSGEENHLVRLDVANSISRCVFPYSFILKIHMVTLEN